MSKIVLRSVLSVFIVLCIACKKEVEIVSTLEKIVVNSTENTLFYIVSTTAGKDSLLVEPKDSAGLVFCTSRMVKTSFLGGTEADGVGLRSETIFNLTDTCKFSPKTIYKSLYQGNYKDSLYYNQISLSVAGTNIDFQEKMTLYYSDLLKPIMEKDYSMLERFPEYYKE